MCKKYKQLNSFGKWIINIEKGNKRQSKFLKRNFQVHSSVKENDNLGD